MGQAGTGGRDGGADGAGRCVEPLEGESVAMGEGISAPVTGPSEARGLTPDGRLRTGRLAGLGMWAAIWVLSWPVMVESFLNSFVGLTDTKLAAAIGEAETAAIGGASYIMWFIGLIIMALGIGATALISRSVGKGRIGVANAVLGQTVSLALLCGVAVGVFVALAATPVGWMMNLSEAAMTPFRDYMLVIAAGAPAASVLFALIACARGAGDSIRPLYAMIARNVVNVAASFLLSGVDLTTSEIVDGVATRQVIWANPSPFDLGVIGIALGTVCADVVGAVLVLAMARSGVWGIRLRARRMRMHRITVLRLWRLGMPNFLETFGMWVGNFLTIVMVGWLALADAGRELLGAHIVAIRIEAFSFLPGFAMGAAAATLAGQYLGAGSRTMARRAVWRCTLIAVVIMGAIGLGFALFGQWITGLLSDQPTHLELVPRLLVICGVVQAPFALAIVTRSAMRGAGDVKVVMMLTWVSTYAIRLPLAYLFSGVDVPLPETLGGGVLANPNPYEWGLAGLWIGLCVELAIRGLLFGGRCVQGGWMRATV